MAPEHSDAQVNGSAVDLNQYIQDAVRTENIGFEGILNRMASQQGELRNFNDDIIMHSVLRLLHALTGLATEALEVLDIVRKHVFYGKPIDVTKLVDEFGDVNWFHALGVDALANLVGEQELNLPESFMTSGDLWALIQKLNIQKLKDRHPDKFNKGFYIDTGNQGL